VIRLLAVVEAAHALAVKHRDWTAAGAKLRDIHWQLMSSRDTNAMKILLWVFLFLGCNALAARAYRVELPLSLEKLNAESDVIFKGVALGTSPVGDASFRKLSGFEPVKTRFRVISVLQGKWAQTEIAFHHYAPKNGARPIVPEPQHYYFRKGRAYLVWADKSGKHGRQIRDSHNWRVGQGALRCSDEKPVVGSIKDAVWSELSSRLRNESPFIVEYAIRQLDEMSSGLWTGTPDFERAKVLALLAPFLSSPDGQIALTTIRAVRYEAAQFQEQLLRILQLDDSLSLRAEAMRSLQDVKTPAVQAASMGILRAAPSGSNVHVRYWALIHLGLFPSDATRKVWRDAAKNPGWRERTGVALGIGRAKDVLMLPVLDALLNDANREVRRVAATQLLEFPARDARVWWEKRRKSPDFSPIFTLAKENPAPYIAELSQIMVEKRQPRVGNWSFDGRNPLAVAWQMLHDYAQKQPRAAFANGSLEAVLKALEADGNWGSSQPVAFYRLMREKGLEKRAAAFRAAREKSANYDIAPQFDNADAAIKAQNAQDERETMIRLLAVVEAATVTGPAKNLLEFCRTAHTPLDGGEGVEVSLVTFHRDGGQKRADGEAENEFVAAARAQNTFIAFCRKARV
jgi:hypothetical protein